MRLNYQKMRFVGLYVFMIGAMCGTPMRSRAQAQEPISDSLISYWHKAYFAEVANDLDGIDEAYRQVIRYSAALPAHERQWFLSSAYFGIARANSLIGDRDVTRQMLDSALESHFWNFDMIRNVPSFATLFGTSFVDSICTTWRKIALADSHNWPAQPLIELRPSHMLPGKKYPVVVALHGGNGSYQVFSHRLAELPDEIGAIVVFVPGILRINEAANAWGIDMTSCVSYLDSQITKVLSDRSVDATDVTLMGFSQGSQVCYAYCAEHPERIHAVVAFAGFAQDVLKESELDAKLRSVAAHHVKIVAVSGDRDFDGFLSSTRELQALALKDGASFSYKIEPGLPHGIPEHASDYIRHLWHQMRNRN